MSFKNSRSNAHSVFKSSVLPALEAKGFTQIETDLPVDGFAVGLHGSEADFVDIVPINAVELGINLIWVREGEGQYWQFEAFDRIQDFVDVVDALGLRLRLRDWGDRRDVPGPGYMAPSELTEFLSTLGFKVEPDGNRVRVPRSEEIASA